MSPPDRARDGWLARVTSNAGERLASIREAAFELAPVARHHLVLDLGAGSGPVHLGGAATGPGGTDLGRHRDRRGGRAAAAAGRAAR